MHKVILNTRVINTDEVVAAEEKMKKVVLSGYSELIKKSVEGKTKFFLKQINTHTGEISIVEGIDFEQEGERYVRFRIASHCSWKPKRENLEMYFV